MDILDGSPKVLVNYKMFERFSKKVRNSRSVRSIIESLFLRLVDLELLKGQKFKLQTH